MGRNGFLCASALVLVLSGVAPVWGACAGDCSGDGSVTVDEVVTGVNIALGVAQLSQCTSMDSDGDGRVTVNEIIGALNSALTGCSVATPVATATATATMSAATPTAGPSNGIFISNAPPEAGTTFEHRSTITPNPVAVFVPGVFANITWNEYTDSVTLSNFHGAVNETLSVSINLTNGALTNAIYGVTSIAAVGSGNLPPSTYTVTSACPAPNYCNAQQRGLQIDATNRKAIFSNFEIPRVNGQAVTDKVIVNGTIGF